MNMEFIRKLPIPKELKAQFRKADFGQGKA